MRIDRATMVDLIYGGRSGRRFTQDSPILPDVWIAYAERPGARIDLLLTPYQPRKGVPATPGSVSQLLRDRLSSSSSGGTSRRSKPRSGNQLVAAAAAGPAIAYNQSAAVALLTLEELVRTVLPMSGWWSHRVTKKSKERTQDGDEREIRPKDASDLRKLLTTDSGKLIDQMHQLVQASRSFDTRRPSAVRTEHTRPAEPREAASKAHGFVVRDDVLWMLRIIGTLLAVRKKKGNDYWKPPDVQAHRKQHLREAVDAVAELLGDSEGDDPATVHSVTLNREARLSVWRSTTAVKADAVRRLFNVSCADLTWAVIDSGIDATHPAFRVRTMGTNGQLVASALRDGDPALGQKTRVTATYNFRLIRTVLSEDPAACEDLPKEVKNRLKTENAAEFRRALLSGRELDWDCLGPLLRINHDKHYPRPRYEHGTHVAGVLAGNWPATDTDCPVDNNVVGMCPDLNLFDLRAFDDNGVGDEFTVMSALQFVRHLNANKDHMSIHGVNLSLSIPHDIANYACGATPVCAEADRLVGAGVVVVAAAGNDGYLHYLTKGDQEYDGYQSISITDPGNAEAVITVGSTHRDSPHTYGVSYFSSRGPTGDGRNKPDLVAPGEKIEGPVPETGLKRMDGTSMAAPHVSGAAALLMARYPELIGRPARIKQVLCESATDLGRERYFQGAGMLDVLRAMQAV